VRLFALINTGIGPVGTRRFTGRLLIALLALLLASAACAAQTQDAEYEAVAEEYVKTYLAAHPLQGTALGFHEYDGKISDYSRLALDAELSRLRRFDDRLAKFDPKNLSPRQSIDLRILQAAVKRDIFEMQDMSVFERNPMLYARAGDVNVYIKRNSKYTHRGANKPRRKAPGTVRRACDSNRQRFSRFFEKGSRRRCERT